MKKLSIVILCWNDKNVIGNCLGSIFAGTHATDFEVIVSDNGSTDRTPEFIRGNYGQVRVIENGRNLRFSRGNNVGIAEATGEYVLILNPDTIIHEGSLDRWIRFADCHPEAGAFGCRVLNPDGSYQRSGRPFPTVGRSWIGALGMRRLAQISEIFTSDEYMGWNGDTERAIDWQSGCCLLVRAALLKEIGGFDDQFQYYYEDVDLCRRVWDAGFKILFVPDVTITHLGGQSTKDRFPIPFELDKHRNRYRYFYKYFGEKGVHQCRLCSLAGIRIRQAAYRLVSIVKPSDRLQRRLELYRAAAEWNRLIHPVEFVKAGTEPANCMQPALRVPH